MKKTTGGSEGGRKTKWPRRDVGTRRRRERIIFKMWKHTHFVITANLFHTGASRPLSSTIGRITSFFSFRPHAGIGATGVVELWPESPDRGAEAGTTAADPHAEPPPAHVHRQDGQRPNGGERGRVKATAHRRERAEDGQHLRAGGRTSTSHLHSEPYATHRGSCGWIVYSLSFRLSWFFCFVCDCGHRSSSHCKYEVKQTAVGTLLYILYIRFVL